MSLPTPRRHFVPDTAQLRALSDIGYTSTYEVLAERILALPESDPFTPVCRQWWTVRLCRKRAEYQAALPVLMGLIRHAPLAGAFRYILRIDLSDALMRMGFPERSERLIRKAMGSVTFGEQEGFVRGAFFAELGRFYRRRGQMSLALQMYEQALECHPNLNRGQFTAVINMFDVLLNSDRLDQARALLAGLGAYDHVESARPMLWYRDAVWLAYHLETRDAAACLPYLERLRESIGGEAGTRNKLLFMNLEAEILLVAGRYTEAAPMYERVLDLCMRSGPYADLVGNVSRGFAECLLHLGDPVRAEDRASAGIRYAARGDRMEELAGLRVQAQCRWAMGRHDEARELFTRLQAMHTAFEFVRERKRLDTLMAEMGILPLQRVTASLNGIANGTTHSRERGAWVAVTRSRGAEPTRFRLADGRDFVTHDLELVRQIRRAAESDLPVLIEGETGTGKDLVAHLIHELGPRARTPFVVADCATLPEGLVESELFGAARGAYSGSHESRTGIVARAHGGTLFLDELTELSLLAQAKLLRLIQDGSYRRVGESEARSVSARFIAATNRAIGEALAQKRLKLDLYHRLNGHRIHLRPLRERRDEIEGIAQNLIRRAGVEGISPDAVRFLERLPWPGNVRELEMALRVVASWMEPGEVIELSHLDETLSAPATPAPPGLLRDQRREARRTTLEEALRTHHGNVAAAARSLGISRQALYQAIKRAGTGERASTNG